MASSGEVVDCKQLNTPSDHPNLSTHVGNYGGPQVLLKKALLRASVWFVPFFFATVETWRSLWKKTRSLCRFEGLVCT